VYENETIVVRFVVGSSIKLNSTAHLLFGGNSKDQREQ
jgi:hypothetical protein